jgi:magnesium transporter
MSFEITHEYINKIEDALKNQDIDFIKATFEEMYAADASLVLYELNTEQCKYIIEHLDIDFAAEIISSVDDDTRKAFLKNFNSERISSFLKFIESDDCADILNDLTFLEREEVLAYIEKDDKEKALHITDLLRYDEDVAGGLMAKELIKANINWSLNQCIEEIRRQTENVEKCYSVYVVNDDDKLLGRVSLKKIVLSNESTIIKDIYDDDIISVESHLPADEVAEMMQKYDLEAIPVVNTQGKLLGRITIDDIMDFVTEQTELDIQAMTGVSEKIEEDDSVWMLSRARLPWLMIGMAGGLTGAMFMGQYEKELAIIPAMAFFIPLITATGGNVGVQSSAIVVQSLASNALKTDSMFWRLFKVLIVAIINGLVLSLLVFGFNMLIGNTQTLAIVVSVSLFCVVILASFLGTTTPLLLDKIGINPALASGPFITTANDLVGLAVYFMLGNFLYHI